MQVQLEFIVTKRTIIRKQKGAATSGTVRRDGKKLNFNSGAIGHRLEVVRTVQKINKHHQIVFQNSGIKLMTHNIEVLHIDTIESKEEVGRDVTSERCKKMKGAKGVQMELGSLRFNMRECVNNG